MMLDDRRDLLIDDLKSMLLTVEVGPNQYSFNNTSRMDLVDQQALSKVKHTFDYMLSSIKIGLEWQR